MKHLSDEYLDAVRLAKLFNCHRNYIYKLEKLDGFPAALPKEAKNSHRLWYKKEIMEWIKKNPGKAKLQNNTPYSVTIDLGFDHFNFYKKLSKECNMPMETFIMEAVVLMRERIGDL